MGDYGNKPPPKKGGAEKKSGGGFWGFLGDVLSNASVAVNVGAPRRTGSPSGNPTDPAERMAPVHEERKEAYEETIYRKTEGEHGTPPAARLERGRNAVARSLDGRTTPQHGARIPEGGGSPLSRDVRAKMEPRLGSDLSDVRVHTSSESAASAEGLSAKAFTVGKDVHFAAGGYQPGTKEGDRLLAHELTHVVQGQRSGVQRKTDDAAEREGAAGSEVSHPDEPAEKEADSVGDKVAGDLHERKGEEGGATADGAGGDGQKDQAGKGQGQAAPAPAGDVAKSSSGGLGKIARKPADGPLPISASIGATVRRKVIFRKKTAAPSTDASGAGAKASNNPATTAKPGRVDKPVPGLMGSIDPASTPSGWHIQDKYRVEGNMLVVRTDVVDPAGKAGWVERGYDKVKKQFVMLNAFLITPGEDKSTGVQSFIEHKEPTMIQGKGTPTQTFLTLRQMKLLEQHAGMKTANLEKVKMSTIQNVEAILQLEQLKRKGLKAEDALMQTHSKQYAETTLVQAGKKIVSGKIVGGVETPIMTLLQHYEAGQKNRQENFQKLLDKYAVARTDKVLWNYDIEFEVDNFDSGKAK